MKRLAFFLLLLAFPVILSGQESLKEQMLRIYERYGMNFVYDETIDVDAPSSADISQTESLEEALEAFANGNGLIFETNSKFIVLKKADRVRDYIIFIEEQRDTLSESRITVATDRDRNTTQTGLMKIDSRKFKRGFAFMGSPDVIKTLQMMPGVSAGTELMSGLYVHGGTGTDNLFLLDGVPLYQVSHLAGLFSSFNTEVIDNLDFYKSGFPARYGGRLSSVVDVTTRRGDMYEYKGMFTLGAIDGNIQFEGPIVKGKTSFNVALRRSWSDLITTPALMLANRKNGDGSKVFMNYAFYDGNAGITHIIDSRNTLSFNFYMGRDYLRIRMEEEELDNNMRFVLNWGNILASLKWECDISDELRSRVMIYNSSNRSKIGIEMEGADGIETLQMETANLTRVNDLGVKGDFDWIPSPYHHIRFGGAYQYHIYYPERYSNFITAGAEPTFAYSDKARYDGHEPTVYIEDEINATGWFKVNAGLRAATFSVPGKTYFAVEPRLALRFQISSGISLKASYTEMNQFNHQVATNYMDLPTNTWMPVTSKIRPMHSRQIAGGIYMNLPEDIVLNIEGYWKTMDRLLEYTGANALYPPLDEWESSFSEGEGRAYGTEVELAWRTDRTDLAAYYTLAWNERHFADIHPLWYPDRNDHRHKLTLAGSHRFGKRLDVYAAWNWHSGSRITGYSHISGEHNFHYSRPNNIKMPPYHRLDIGMNFRKTTRRGNESIWNLSVYNVYCRMNPFFAFVTKGEDGEFIGTSIGIIPIIPSISYTLRF